MTPPTVTVRIPSPLRRFTGGQEELLAQGATLAAVIDDLEKRHAGVRERLLDEENRLRRFVNVYVNDEDVRFLQNLDTPMSAGDTVSVVPAIAGGRGRDG
jgi:molybdopterin synthase sulfur carrier subunit